MKSPTKSAGTSPMTLRPTTVPLASLTRKQRRFVKRVRSQRPAVTIRAGWAGKHWP